MKSEKSIRKGKGAIRELLTASGIYSVAVVAQRVGSILLLPVYTRVLTPDDYAVTELLDLTLSLFSMLFGGQFASALFYYFSRASTEQERNSTASTVLLGAFILGLLAGGAVFVAAPFLSKLVFQTYLYSHYFRIASVSLALTFPFEAALNWLRAINKPKLFVAASILRLGLGIVMAVVLLLGFKMKVAGVLWSTLISLIITTATVSGYFWFRIPIRFDVPLFWRLFRYSAPIGGVSISMFLIHFGDRFFLQRFASLADVGIYSLAYKISMSVGILQQAFSAYWSAQVYAVLALPDGRRIFARVLTYLIFAMSSAGVLITLAAPAFLGVIAAPAYYPAVVLIPWLVMIYVVRAVVDHIRAIFYVENKTGMDATLAIVSAGICLAGYFTLIPRFKSYGAVAATALAFFALLMLAYWRAQRLWPFYLERARLAKLIVAVTVPVTLSYLLPLQSAGLPVQIGKALGSIAIYAGLIKVLGFVTPEERDRLSEIYKEGWNRLRTA